MKLDEKRQHLLKIYFCAKLAQQLDGLDWILNMDETTINGDTKNNYTWLIRRTSGSVKNICINGSANLKTTISSTGSSYSDITKWTTDSRVIMEYLKELFQMVQNREHIPPNKTLLMLDNTPYHRAGVVMNFLESSGIEFMFLPSYTPELAPVEKLFAQLKSKIEGAEMIMLWFIRRKVPEWSKEGWWDHSGAGKENLGKLLR